MIHPKTQIQLVNDQVGCGVFATHFIPKGTITYVKDELELAITPEQFEGLDPIVQQKVEMYSYIENQGNRIVSWDHGKYVNHCCDCNTMSTGYGFEIAIRDIYPGEEVTDEYGLFNVPDEMDLQCAKPNCRMRIHASDIDRYYEAWDAKVKSALALMSDVEQPLFPLLDTDTVDRVNHYLSDNTVYESVLNLKKKEVESSAGYRSDY